MFYNFWVVRYVPNTVRGEFVNIGLLVGRDGADWSFRAVNSLRRASRLGGDATAASYWISEFTRRTRADVKPLSQGSSDVVWLSSMSFDSELSEGGIEALRGRLNNTVQLSDRSIVVADSSQAAVGVLFDELVEDPESHRRTTFRTRISHSLEEALRAQLRKDSAVHVDRTSAIKLSTGEGRIDLSVSERHAEQLTRAWSFNLQDITPVMKDIHAWAYLVKEIQRKGASLTTPRGRIEVPPQVRFNVIYDEPRSAEHQESFKIARAVWDGLGNFRTYSAEQEHLLVEDTLALVS